MKSILPVDYMFSSQNVLTPDKLNNGFWDKIPNWSFLLIFTAIMLLITFIVPRLFFGKDTDKIRSISCELVMAFITFLGFAAMFTSPKMSDLDAPLHKPYATACEFRLQPNSNLVVKQVKNKYYKYPKYENEKTKYPYRLYLKDVTTSNKLIYLGKTDGQQINLDNSTKTGRLFTNYYYYVQKHHLANHFKHTLYLERDPDVTNANGVPQYALMLEGDDITLKIKPNKASTYQIYTDKD